MWGAIAQGSGMKILGDQSPYSGIQGEAPVVGLGDEVSQKLQQFADIVSRFWL